MNVLLDACALIALANGALPGGAANALRTADRAVVSVVSPWEIAIKTAAGKLELVDAPLDWFEKLARRHRLEVMALDASTACAAAALPPIHRDPFDRILVAAALRHSFTILTADTIIPTYPAVRALW